ncbi:hypothetical protein A2715_03780 [Candidatus Woesebacteria bacterium RIFCSPHIGHO2_01_FULL_39_32]|uniref:DUF4367 domain-containing protein n=1 Tax=Candidatus Woesebacteria bacterium RIFCSPLOWO2_01_FULL_39_25 TaxID=1802521 RepID=A0A1F8BJ03_9BACT|nr:MAG: hypothetical protein A2715_03780 [Candidatus Woesebacteria bacterium RIFCSPHIGHO2_01_FULL_39_32]OGM36623.1 MAG: hypothetical protein A3F01_05700 [Candidatus Woesebacteria bacterium RIFCSPHIGHO2_12_FULL_38_11]OGM63950.1 MAG: hypothetical protein A2893_00370 [Candidatus Woesebacteria bacterium RIFCSPLOWO2_01_FULL_39_25]
MQSHGQKKPDILKVGVFIMFLALAFLSVYLYLNKSDFVQTSSVVSPTPGKTTGDNINPTATPNLKWEEYRNEEFRFRVERPKFLYEREFKDQGGYVFFIRFEETKFSIEKGVAIGVSGKTYEEEVEGTKTILTESGAKLVKEDKITVDDFEGTRLDFEPTGEGEKRSVVIFSKGDYSYSISTVPEQVEKVIESFKFLE